jgi:hypothetical protein
LDQVEKDLKQPIPFAQLVAAVKLFALKQVRSAEASNVVSLMDILSMCRAQTGRLPFSKSSMICKAVLRRGADESNSEFLSKNASCLAVAQENFQVASIAKDIGREMRQK